MGLSESDPEQLLKAIRRLDGAATPCELKTTMPEINTASTMQRSSDDYKTTGDSNRGRIRLHPERFPQKRESTLTKNAPRLTK